MTHRTLPIEVLWVLHQLHNAGFEAYIAGGAVRDLLDPSSAATSVTDFDCTTSALPEQIQELFPEHFYENSFGTVTVVQKYVREQLRLPPLAPPKREHNQDKIIDVSQATKVHTSLEEKKSDSQNQDIIEWSGEKYEITTFRSDEVYDATRRKPTSMSWGKSLQEDVLRRDFTINALALEVSSSFLESIEWQKPPESVTLSDDQYQIHDFVGGKNDLEAGIVRCVGDSSQRFQEDALRMLRAIRFSVQKNFSIDQAAFQAISTHADLITAISPERIRDEFIKMLASEYPKEAVELLDHTGLLKHIIPELLESKGVQQGGHHTTDVWVHSLDALDCCPSPDPIVRLATLLHDIGKPRTFKILNGAPTFYNHEVVGAHMVKDIARRLHFSRAEISKLFILVRQHMFYYQPEQTDAALRRFMRKVGLEYIDDILDLREGDRLGSGARRTSWRLEEMKKRMIGQLHQPFSVTDLAINGHDLMGHLQLKPGPDLGKILNHLFEIVLENPELNTKEHLLAEAAKV